MVHVELLDLLREAFRTDMAVATALGVHNTSISRWRRFGIPAHLWTAIANLARKQGIKVTPQQIADAAPAPPRGRAIPEAKRYRKEVAEVV